MSKPDLPNDDALLEALSAALDDLDPVPGAAQEAALAAWDLCHAQGELARLLASEDADGPALLLRDETASQTFTFVASKVVVELEIDADGHGIGVLTPPSVSEIAVETASAQKASYTRAAYSDELGRFQLDLGTGLCRLRIGRADDAVFTSWFYC